MERPGCDVGVVFLHRIINDDVPEFAVGIGCPVAVEQAVGNVCLQGVAGHPVDALLVCLAVGAAQIGENLGGESDIAAVGRHCCAVCAQRIIGDLFHLTVFPQVKLGYTACIRAQVEVRVALRPHGREALSVRRNGLPVNDNVGC